ncbi:hypothetical protein ACHHYP_04846 [Achlya hypogyna]|uniref:Uncharacterized protein n=1 Tax=Achlya hypogyna TaxID=1202772 RepID=A0A1V9YZX3_ACHHY|nr:hypothetical protein ACHHYP_04846 [Achlya hypogyna]
MEPKSDWQVESERYLWAIPSPWYSREPETYHIAFGVRFHRWQLLAAAVGIHAVLGFITALGGSRTSAAAFAGAFGLTAVAVHPLLRWRGPRTALVLGTASVIVAHIAVLLPTDVVYGALLGAGASMAHIAVVASLQPPAHSAVVRPLFSPCHAAHYSRRRTVRPRVSPVGWALGTGGGIGVALLLLTIVVRTPPPDYCGDDGAPIVISTAGDTVRSRAFAALGVATAAQAAITALLSLELSVDFAWTASDVAAVATAAVVAMVAVGWTTDLACGRSPVWRRHLALVALFGLQLALAVALHALDVSSGGPLAAFAVGDIVFFALLPVFLWDQFGPTAHLWAYGLLLALGGAAAVVVVGAWTPMPLPSHALRLACVAVAAVSMVAICFVPTGPPTPWACYSGPSKRSSILMTEVVAPPRATVQAFVESQQRASELVLLARDSVFSQAILAPRSSTGGSSIYI